MNRGFVFGIVEQTSEMLDCIMSQIQVVPYCVVLSGCDSSEDDVDAVEHGDS